MEKRGGSPRKHKGLIVHSVYTVNATAREDAGSKIMLTLHEKGLLKNYIGKN